MATLLRFTSCNTSLLIRQHVFLMKRTRQSLPDHTKVFFARVSCAFNTTVKSSAEQLLALVFNKKKRESWKALAPHPKNVIIFSNTSFCQFCCHQVFEINLFLAQLIFEPSQTQTQTDQNGLDSTFTPENTAKTVLRINPVFQG